MKWLKRIVLGVAALLLLGAVGRLEQACPT